MFIDTHCHIFDEYYDDIEKVIKNMKNNIMIVNGTNSKTNKEVIKLCNKYNNIYGTLGIHPSEVDRCTEEDLKFIEENLSNPKIVGIGEIGLDYYWSKENKEKQKEIFLKQIKIAIKYNKTIVVHSRDAINDTYNILKNEKETNLKIVMHCYASSIEMAKNFVEIGAMIGIGGVITFKNAKKIREVVEVIDINQLVLETDSPFLSPEPYRGEKNEPINVEVIAQKIADIKNINVKEVNKITTNNAIRQFDLNIDLC